MNGQNWVGWLVVIIMVISSIVLLMGKGSFLIAGFNTSSKEKKEQYDEKKLCRVVGGGLGIISIMMGISFAFKLPDSILKLMMPWGIFVVAALMIILTNTVCRKK
ncbi:MAG: hypothetical protein K0R54_3191 [Clostridiaceae bacterium]|jgi:uncharacterized membrane protein YfcA|nr:hypothetical protein [Clostridiaceae bacterium]